MIVRTLSFTAAMVLTTATSVVAQDNNQMPSPTELPEQCQQGGSGQLAGDMSMENMNMSGMTDAQKAYMEAMMKMNPAMMQGMMNEDPDLAFACAMIAHHQGALDMSQVELEYGDNDEAKKIAQKTIDAQKKDIEELKTWIDEHAG